MMVSEILKDIIIENANNLFKIKIDKNIKLEIPPSKQMGDFAFPIGFNLSKELKQNPFSIVEKLSDNINSNQNLIKTEPARPGFLNIFLTNDFIKDLVKKNFEKENFDFPKKDRKVIIEFVSANPTGPLHIGHGRWAALGDSIARLLEKVGYDVYREFYVNDAGKQIENLKKTVVALRKGEQIPEDGYRGEYIKEAINEDNPHLYFLDQQKKTLERFNVFFNNFFHETQVYNNITHAIESLKAKGLIYERDGAIWFKSTEYGDDKDRVLIKSDGSYTYFAPDIAYHLTKIERGFDWIIDILGADHHGYVNRLSAAIKALSNREVRFSIIIGQLVNLFRDKEPVRMSKRTGDIITLDEVIDEIGKDALRYILVSKKASQSIDFDIEEVKRKSKSSPVFYIQYAFARINSILSKVGDYNLDTDNFSLDNMNNSERELLIEIIKFKDTIFQAAIDMEPHILANYLLNISGIFHNFYETSRVIDNGIVVEHRLFIIKAVSNVLKEGLKILGIESPEKM
ncbi:MAG TPA: arginine--tRNA ligase [Spirochaetota bacterium]|nr:arginine--tRNA ligase [Spirochaetota bacterium]HOM38113.1 arginine--tRNA ligase [Spirochaetota bacterium]HPQ48915.1 arginine--tRNA ligase [Spirochaetota bacterium]